MISQNVAYALIYSLFEATLSMRLHELVCTVHTNTRARAPTHHNTPGDKWAELSGRNFIQSGASIECCCWAASCSLFVVCFSFIATQRTERSQHAVFFFCRLYHQRLLLSSSLFSSAQGTEGHFPTPNLESEANRCTQRQRSRRQL